MTPNEEYACDNCNFGQNGAVCALHGVEVERRKSTAKLVEDLEEMIKPTLRFMYVMSGVALLGALVITGGYMYTSSVERTLSARQDVARVKIENLNSDVQSTKLSLAVTEDRYMRIFQQLDSISRSIEQLTEKQKQADGWGPK